MQLNPFAMFLYLLYLFALFYLNNLYMYFANSDLLELDLKQFDISFKDFDFDPLILICHLFNQYDILNVIGRRRQKLLRSLDILNYIR